MAIPNQPGLAHNNGKGVEPMEQFDKIFHKLNNTLRNLEFTRDMLKQLADNERQSSKLILSILDNSNKRKKGLKFSKVDENIQSYWENEAKTREHFADKIYQTLLSDTDEFINLSRGKRKTLQKNNKSVQNQFDENKKQFEKHRQSCMKAWKSLDKLIGENEKYQKTNKTSKVKSLKPTQEKCSKAFEKCEAIVTHMNSLEMENHGQSCDACELIHKSQVLAGKRLKIHYDNAIRNMNLSKKFVSENEQMITYKPSKEVLFWKWISYPKKHHSTLPCSANEVFSRTEAVQRFSQKKLHAFQTSKRLMRPTGVTGQSGQAHNRTKSQQQQAQKQKEKHPPKQKQAEKEEQKLQQQQHGSGGKKHHKSKNKKKRGKKDENQVTLEKQEAHIGQKDADEGQVNNDWGNDFAFDNDNNDNNDNNNNNVKNDKNADEDAFGDTGFGFGSTNDDLFGSSNGNAETNGNQVNDDPFGDGGGFGFGNEPSQPTQTQTQTEMKTDDVFGSNDNNDVFGGDDNNDVFGGGGGDDNNDVFGNDTNSGVFGSGATDDNNDPFGNNDGTPTGVTATATATYATDMTGVTANASGFGDLNNDFDFDMKDTNNNDGGMMADAFDEEDNDDGLFDDEVDIVFPEFGDSTATATNATATTTTATAMASDNDPFGGTGQDNNDVFGSNTGQNGAIETGNNMDAFGDTTNNDFDFGFGQSNEHNNASEPNDNHNPFGDLAASVAVSSDPASGAVDNPFEI